jgi:hypothetical protein
MRWACSDPTGLANTSAVRSNKSMLTHNRFKQPDRSGDATRPSAAGRSFDDFPENAPCQPVFAFSARGACGLRHSTSRDRREVASDTWPQFVLSSAL